MICNGLSPQGCCLNASLDSEPQTARHPVSTGDVALFGPALPSPSLLCCRCLRPLRNARSFTCGSDDLRRVSSISGCSFSSEASCASWRQIPPVASHSSTRTCSSKRLSKKTAIVRPFSPPELHQQPFAASWILRAYCFHLLSPGTNAQWRHTILLRRWFNPWTPQSLLLSIFTEIESCDAQRIGLHVMVNAGYEGGKHQFRRGIRKTATARFSHESKVRSFENAHNKGKAHRKKTAEASIFLFPSLGVLFS